MYYYEEKKRRIGDFGDFVFEWVIYSPDSKPLAKATTEENANLIVTLMNGVG